MLLFCVLSIDVANWFVHKRHLQNQADAAALAAGGMFPFPNCDDIAIRAKANEYSGKAWLYNAPKPTVTPQSRLHAEIMSATTSTSRCPATPTCRPAPARRPLRSDKLFVDVKMTEDEPAVVLRVRARAEHQRAGPRPALQGDDRARGCCPSASRTRCPKTVRAYGRRRGDRQRDRRLEHRSLASTPDRQPRSTSPTRDPDDVQPARPRRPNGSASAWRSAAPRRRRAASRWSAATTPTVDEPRAVVHPHAIRTHRRLTANAAPQALSVSLSPGDLRQRLVQLVDG